MMVEKTSSIKPGDNLVMVVYGKGGVGKTTFAASAPKTLLLDFENGSKYLGDRGIDIDVIRMKSWLTDQDKKELAQIIQPYQTIAMDPLGEAMDKLIDSPTISGSKHRQKDGSLSMAGWGEAKRQMRSFIKWLRDLGKNVIIVAHVAEERDEDSITHRIQVATKLREEIPNMVDVISYLGVKNNEGNPVRVLYTPRQTDRFDSKDRTQRVPMTVEISPDNGFNDLLKAMKVKQQHINTEEAPKPPEIGKKEADKPVENEADKAIGELNTLLQEAVDNGLIDEDKKNTVLSTAKGYKQKYPSKQVGPKVIRDYTAKIKEHIESLKQPAEQPEETEPEEAPAQGNEGEQEEYEPAHDGQEDLDIF